MSIARELFRQQVIDLNRRWFLRHCGVGLAGIALNSLLAGDVSAGEKSSRMTARSPHFAPQAKRVIYLFQAGAPSQLEMFDPKPKLAEHHGSLPPAELIEGYRSAFIKPNSALMGPSFSFSPQGDSGIELSELIPHTSAIADKICLIRSLHTEAVNHAPAQIMMNTGSQQFGRPSFGTWTLYGLGSESANLPG